MFKIYSIISKNHNNQNNNLKKNKKKTSIFKYEVENKNKSTTKKNSNFVNNINKINNLNYLLVANESLNGSRKNLIQVFLNNEWLIEKKFIDNRYRTSLILLKKVK